STLRGVPRSVASSNRARALAGPVAPRPLRAARGGRRLRRARSRGRRSSIRRRLLRLRSSASTYLDAGSSSSSLDGAHTVELSLGLVALRLRLFDLALRLLQSTLCLARLGLRRGERRLRLAELPPCCAVVRLRGLLSRRLRRRRRLHPREQCSEPARL